VADLRLRNPSFSASYRTYTRSVDMYGPFHRLRNSTTQTPNTDQKQIDSGMLWGTTPRGGKGPTAQAYFGPLPPGSSGIEFVTSTRPHQANLPNGHGANWYFDDTAFTGKIVQGERGLCHHHHHRHEPGAMKVTPSSFDAVFDGTANFVPRAILDISRVDVPNIRDLMSKRAIHGEDGLDKYDAVPMILHTDDGHMRRFALWRHAHNPAGQVAIQLPLGEDYRDTLLGIMQAMRIPAAAIVWLDETVMSGRRGAAASRTSPLRRSRMARPRSQ